MRVLDSNLCARLEIPPRMAGPKIPGLRKRSVGGASPDTGRR
jgi:hypothetical protein